MMRKNIPIRFRSSISVFSDSIFPTLFSAISSWRKFIFSSIWKKVEGNFKEKGSMINVKCMYSYECIHMSAFIWKLKNRIYKKIKNKSWTIQVVLTSSKFIHFWHFFPKQQEGHFSHQAIVEVTLFHHLPLH